MHEVRIAFKRLFYKLTCQRYEEQDNVEGSPVARKEKEITSSQQQPIQSIELKDSNYQKQQNRLSRQPRISLQEIVQVKQNIHFKSLSSSDDESTDLPVAKETSLEDDGVFVSKDNFDSSQFDQPDPSEETEL